MEICWGCVLSLVTAAVTWAFGQAVAWLACRRRRHALAELDQSPRADAPRSTAQS